MIVVVIVIIAAIAVIVTAELIDKRKSGQQKRVLQEGIKVTGTVISVERSGISDRRSVYKWQLSAAFEYNGNTYTLEQGSISRPVLQTGDHVTIYVNHKYPWKSFFTNE